MPIDSVKYEQNVKSYKRLINAYRKLAKDLRAILEPVAGGICQCAIVQARPKSVPSFAEKILRKGYTEPLRQMTDLCGVRVIVHMREEVEAVCAFIRRNFIIEEGEDKLSRLRTTEFGYRSWHYIVRLREQEYKTAGKPLRPKARLCELRAEIQVRTIIQHAWADIGHDRIYKGPVAPSPEWKRETARLAAQLEAVDHGFDRLVGSIDALRPFAGRNVDEEALKPELERLEAVRTHDPKNAAHLVRICRLLLFQQHWKEVIARVEEFPGAASAALLTCAGIAWMKEGKHARSVAALKQAVKVSPTYVEAHVRLTEAALEKFPKAALKHAEAAFELAPRNPEAVCCLVRAKLANQHDFSFLRLLKPVLEDAVRECHVQAVLGMNVPWALYQAGELHMLLGPDHELPALEAWCQAVTQTPASLSWMVDETLNNLRRYEAVARQLPCLELSRKVLLMAQGLRRRDLAALAAELKPFATRGTSDQELPVVIVVGGCDPDHKTEMESYRGLLSAALAIYRGTVFSGATREGIPGIVGELAQASNGRFQAIGYLSEKLPRDGTATEDKRYKERRRTTGADHFTAREPLQNWIDLLAAGMDPAKVTILGINGGKIAAFEYRLGLMLGAAVGVVRESGREANVLTRDAEQRDIPGLMLLPRDPMTLQAFVMQEARSLIEEPARTEAAKAVHAHFVKNLPVDETSLPWHDLAEIHQQSNVALVDHIGLKLEAIGLRAVPVANGDAITLPADWEKHVEQLAEMEHGRWVADRMRLGFKLGPRDATHRPSLVAWKDKDLPEKEREKDRNFIRIIPELLRTAGFEIRRK